MVEGSKKPFACCSRYDLAQKQMQTYISSDDNIMKFYEKAIKLLNEGKTSYRDEYGYKIVLDKSLEYYQEHLEHCKKFREWAIANTKIVELEMRA